jgi:hypothetical protein
MAKTRICEQYTGKDGITRGGCRQALRWKSEPGTGRFGGYYVHQNGQRDCGGATQQQYQQTYAPQIDQEAEQNQIYSQGLREAQSNSISERFLNESVRTIQEAVSDARIALDKATSINNNQMQYVKDLVDFKTDINKKFDSISERFTDLEQGLRVADADEDGHAMTLAQVIKRLDDRVVAFLKNNSFVGANQLQTKTKRGAGKLEEVEPQQHEEVEKLEM